MYFFENEEKLDIMIEDKEEVLATMKQKQVVVKESKAAKDAEYVPPEVFKRYS